MNIPKIQKQPLRTVSIPDLAGGLNLRDGSSQIPDNQLTDAVNVWFRDGVLKTRFGSIAIKNDDNELNKYICGEYEEEWQLENVDIKITDVTKAESGCVYKLVAFKSKYYYEVTDASGVKTHLSKHRFSFVWISEQGDIEQLSAFEIGTESDLNFFVFAQDSVIYCFINNREIYIYTKDSEENVGTEKWSWKKMGEDETEQKYYIPTVLTHCKPINGGYSTSGTQFEGYNLLTPYYKMVFSTVNLDEDTHNMRYNLVTPIPLNKNGTITAEITNPKTGVKTTHTVTWSGSQGDATYHENINNLPGDGYQMFVNHGFVMFALADKENATNTAIAQLEDTDYLEDNLVITAFGELALDEQSKIFNMTRAEWFGGASAGINGGTRLFLCGNTNKADKNLVIWSGLNEPLYFSENCYFRVGDSSQAVTALGKQSDMLVIFKEHETYYTRYTQSDSITAESLINQSVVDYTASSVYFPLTQIHASIGCDCPDTLQLCRNRLVWTNSNGKVYTLVSNNQYSERNIYEVGEMIEQRLSTEGSSALKAATACDWEGHYVLLVGPFNPSVSAYEFSLDGAHAYLMDYNSSGYQYVYSYQKNEDANMRIPWWYWKFPLVAADAAASSALLINGTLVLLCCTDSNISIYRLSEGKKDDAGTVIDSAIQTKAFDFGVPQYNKRIYTVNLFLGDNGGEPVKAILYTDDLDDTDEEIIELLSTAAYSRRPDYIKEAILRPCIGATPRVSIRLESEGVLAVDGMCLNYRIIGGRK